MTQPPTPPVVSSAFGEACLEKLARSQIGAHGRRRLASSLHGIRKP